MPRTDKDRQFNHDIDTVAKIDPVSWEAYLEFMASAKNANSNASPHFARASISLAITNPKLGKFVIGLIDRGENLGVFHEHVLKRRSEFTPSALQGSAYARRTVSSPLDLQC